jgi:peptide/nickel transport system permease protein
MILYLLRELARVVVTVFGVVTIAFLVLRITGNPVDALLPPNATAQQRAQLIRELGLNKSVLVQYGRFLDQVVHGQFGSSIIGGGPALKLVLSQIKPTLGLVGLTLACAALLGVTGGVVAAVNRGGWVDRLVGSIAVIAQAMPSYWLALLLILVFAVHLQVLPATGTTGIQSIVLPCATLTFALVPYVLRITRSSMIEVLGSDFIRLHRAKGLPAGSILFRHALRSSLGPVVAMLGLQTGLLMSGVVVVEQIFGRAGIGSLLVSSILSRDYPVVQAAVLLIALVVVLANLLADVAVALLDPRIRVGRPR